MSTNLVRGKTIEFRFRDGPMAGRSFTHRFHADGSVDFGAAGTDKKTHVDKCEVAKVKDDVYGVSYLGPSGYTLSVILNFENHQLVAFSSDKESMQMSHGHFDVAA